MVWPRRVWEVLVGAWIGAWLTRALLDWVLGQEGTWVEVSIAAAGLVGAVLAIPTARGVEPWPERTQRDALLGWGTVAVIVLVLPCFALPAPFGVIAAGVVVVLGMLALRQVVQATADRVADTEPAYR